MQQKKTPSFLKKTPKTGDIQKKQYLFNGLPASYKDLFDAVIEVNPAYIINFDNYNVLTFLQREGYIIEFNHQYNK